MYSSMEIANTILMQYFERITPRPTPEVVRQLMPNLSQMQALMYIVISEYARQTGKKLTYEAITIDDYGIHLEALNSKCNRSFSEPLTEYFYDATGESTVIARDKGGEERDSELIYKIIADVYNVFHGASARVLHTILSNDDAAKHGSAWHKAIDDGRDVLTLEDMIADHSYSHYLC